MAIYLLYNIILVIRSVSDVLRAQSRFVKFVGGEAAGLVIFSRFTSNHFILKGAGGSNSERGGGSSPKDQQKKSGLPHEAPWHSKS